MMRQRLYTCLLVSAAVAVTWGGRAHAANCALRNPDRQIYEMYPDATSYRSAVATLDKTTKDAVEKRLQSELAFNDLGKHTIYLVLHEDIPIGIVHARSEVGTFGSVELVWAMDLHLTISDFRVQRSREHYTETIKSAEFRQQMVGHDFPDLKGLLQAAGAGKELPGFRAAPEASSIIRTALLCGAKTQIITEVAFADVILRARLLGNAHRFFPETVSVRKVASPFDQGNPSETPASTRDASTTVDPGSFTVLRSVNRDDKTLGYTAYTRWQSHAARPEAWWAISPEGTVREVTVVGDVNAEEKGRLTGLRGLQLAEAPSAGLGASAVDRVAKDVLGLLAGIADG